VQVPHLRQPLASQRLQHRRAPHRANNHKGAARGILHAAAGGQF
jgi:hypothetical protein